MNTFSKLATSSFLALTISAGAFAQDAATAVDAQKDKITKTQEDVADDIAKGQDAERYASSKNALGWSGSFSLGYTGQTFGDKNAEDKSVNDLNLGGRFKYGTAKWSHTLGLGANLKTNTPNGKDDDGKDLEAETSTDAYLTYEANRSFGDRFYGFGLLSGTLDGSGETDAVTGVAGLGVGYRIVNQPNFTWRVQAGPAYNYSFSQGVEDGVAVDVNIGEAGVSAGSRLYYKISNSTFLTNDTDFTSSKNLQNVTNDFGVNFKVADNITARVGYRTDFSKKTDKNIAEKDGIANNKVSMSLVYGF